MVEVVLVDKPAISLARNVPCSKALPKNAEGARYRTKELTIQLKAKMSKSKRDIGNGHGVKSLNGLLPKNPIQKYLAL